MTTVYNFSAGPAVLPKAVLEQAQAELLNYNGTDMSVMELSHRSSSFVDIIERAEQQLRDLMHIPDHYKVLFLQGGATQQFSMVPANLAKGQKVQYVNTGSWATKAIKAAQVLEAVSVEEIASSKADGFTSVPDIAAEAVDPEAAYLHITTNETIGGVTYHEIPNFDGVTLVADMSSNILANDYNVEDFGLIYAGAQKNLGPSGVTIVIVREDLLKEDTSLPDFSSYATQAGKGSMINTPPTFAIYMVGLVLEWVAAQGGQEAMYKHAKERANLLYDYIDQSDLFVNNVKVENRSYTNIPFLTNDPELDKKFIAEADAAGFKQLKGHRSVGGMRASLYNAFPLEGVKALVEFMKAFEEENK
ncbi:3-phosphoserine/phosphohydroxythreonine transaminase [Aerococcus sp. HMSC10H05]|uniref:3-phosphoserine/phosphohydroxythreonine transaminase n=1 Tax=Aerococcus sp. HMSC10H05 TaxID=1581084 RepID=UPI0008A1714C|nr:3-phosphoserine/phosphohydroxythreonine transaminase [Aerococcus sp. HMSC10H05]OFU50095.1 3-phosphoserine/phosphohydroxythreonine aminotransferase [Aerococcus sp. HMSC10H05]